MKKVFFIGEGILPESIVEEFKIRIRENFNHYQHLSKNSEVITTDDKYYIVRFEVLIDIVNMVVVPTSGHREIKR